MHKVLCDEFSRGLQKSFYSFIQSQSNNEKIPRNLERREWISHDPTVTDCVSKLLCCSYENFAFQRNAVKFVGIGVFGLSSNTARPENLWMKMKKLQEYNALNSNTSTRWKYWFKENVFSRVSWFLEFKWCFMYFISWIACSSAGYHRRTHIKHLNSLQFNLFKFNAVPSIE